MAEDAIEIGLGVHGEAGVGQMPLTTANLAVKRLIDHMTNPGSYVYIAFKIIIFIKKKGRRITIAPQLTPVHKHRTINLFLNISRFSYPA